MKAVVVILLLAAIAVGGWILYDRGYLDSVIEQVVETPVEDGEEVPDLGEFTKPEDMNATDPPGTPTEAPSMTSQIEQELEERYPMPSIKPLEEIVDNWNNVPERAFPEFITVDVETDYKLMRDGQEIGSSSSDAGHRAKPMAHQPGQLLVTNTPDGTTRAVVNVEDTDFKEQIEGRYNAFVADAQKKVLSARERARGVLLAAEASGQAGPASPTSDAGSDPMFAPVRQYLSEGKLNSGLLEEVKGYSYLGKESHGGQEYDVVLVDFEVDTIFGMFPNTMKCLLQNGRVVKWLDAESNEERT